MALHELSRRGFDATGPGLRLQVDPPSLARIGEADQAALQALEGEDGAGEVSELSTKLRELLGGWQQLSARLETLDATHENLAAHRIAERTRSFMATARDDETFWTAKGMGFREGDGELPDDDEPTGHFRGGRWERAMLEVAFLRAWREGLENTTYEDWVKAAQLLQDSGTPIKVPPFDRQTLALARSAKWITYDHAGG